MLTTTLTALAALSLTGPLDPSTPRIIQAVQSAQPDGDILRNLYDLRELRSDVHLAEHDALDELMGTVFGQYVGIGHSELLDGVYVVEGTQEQIDQADEMIRGLRAAVARSFVVRVECWQLPAETTVSLGRPLPAGGTVTHWCETIAGARRESVVQSTTTQTYINKWSPVVSDNSVGYDPQPESIDSGLTISILIGQQEGSVVRARFAGELSNASLDERMVEMGGASLPFSSPIITRRILNADAIIPVGEPVVLQVLPGMNEGTSLVLTARVSPADTVFPQPVAPTPTRPARP